MSGEALSWPTVDVATSKQEDPLSGPGASNASRVSLEVRELAFVGDALFEVMVRQWLLTGSAKIAPKQLHQVSTQWVCHTAQAAILDVWHARLTDEERDWVRRGRNVPLGATKKKHKDTVVEQQKATGFEVLVGWWHVTHSSRFDEFVVWLNQCDASLAPKDKEGREIVWPKICLSSTSPSV